MAPGTERVRGAYRVVKTLYTVLQDITDKNPESSGSSKCSTSATILPTWYTVHCQQLLSFSTFRKSSICISSAHLEVLAVFGPLQKINKNIHYLLLFLIITSMFWLQTWVEIVYWCLFPYFHNILRCLRSKNNVTEILVYYVIHTKVECKLAFKLSPRYWLCNVFFFF